MNGTSADLHHQIAAEVALDVQAITTDTTTEGNIIDLNGKLAVDFSIVAGTLTDGTYTALLEDGDEANLGDAAPIPAERILGGALPALSVSDSVERIGFFKLKRFVRLSLVSTGTATGGTIGALAIVNPDLTEPDK